MDDATDYGVRSSLYVSQLNHGLKALRNTLDHMSEIALGRNRCGYSQLWFSETLAKYIAEFTGMPFRTAKISLRH